MAKILKDSDGSLYHGACLTVDEAADMEEVTLSQVDGDDECLECGGAIKDVAVDDDDDETETA